MVEGPQSVRELLTYHRWVVEDLYVEVESAQPDASFATPVVAQMAGKAMQSGVYVHKVTHAVMHCMSAPTRKACLPSQTCRLSLIHPLFQTISTDMRWSPRFGRSAIPVTLEP